MSVYIIGNGYSINLVKTLEYHKLLDEESIDLTNLFCKGDKIPTTHENYCYLSKDNCPNLWELGIRSTTSREESIKIINNIISSYILYLQENKLKKTSYDVKEKCVQTYNELNRYLKKLIIYYDSVVRHAFETMSLEDRDNIIREIPFINEITEDDIIISYNYDVFLEKLLDYKQIKYEYVLDKNMSINKCVKIYKPHGSINFESVDTENEYIYDILPSNIAIKADMDLYFTNTLIIPPSGFIIGKEGSWVYNVRKGIEAELLNNTPKKAYVFGLSYDVVDRDEINEILSCLDKKITQLMYIDVNPSNTLDHIISQHFVHYCQKKNWR